MKGIEDIKKYYADIVEQYDETAGYKVPRADKIIAKMKLRHQSYLRGYDVLEIACGTGYWTEVIAKSANSLINSSFIL